MDIKKLPCSYFDPFMPILYDLDILGLNYGRLKIDDVVSIHNMASNESFYQISVRSWQMCYQIKAPNRGGSFVFSLGIFSSCHGNGSQELVKTEKNCHFILSKMPKCDLPQVNAPMDFSMVIKNFLSLDQFVPILFDSTIGVR